MNTTRKAESKEAQKIVAMARETIGCSTSPDILATLTVEETTYYLVGFNTYGPQVMANPTLARYPSFIYRQEVNGRPAELVRLRPPPVTIYMSVNGNNITLDEDVDLPPTMRRVIEGKFLHLIYDPLSRIILVSIGRTLQPIDAIKFIDTTDKNLTRMQKLLIKRNDTCSISMVLHYSKYVAQNYLGEDSAYVFDTNNITSKAFVYPPEVPRSELANATQSDAFVISNSTHGANIILRHTATRNRTFQIAPKYGPRSFCTSEDDIRETLSQLYLASTYYSKEFKKEERFNTWIYSMVPTMFDNEKRTDTFSADKLKYTDAVGKTYSCSLPHAELYDSCAIADLDAELMELLDDPSILYREGYELTCVKRALSDYDLYRELDFSVVRLCIRSTFAALVVTACISSPYTAEKIRATALEWFQHREEVVAFAVTAYTNSWMPSEKHQEMHRILTAARNTFAPKRPDTAIEDVIAMLVYNEAPKTFAKIDLQALTLAFEE